VSHEAIYRTLCVQSRSALKRELTEHLRTRRRIRRPGGRNYRRTDGRGQLVDIVHILQRPAEAEDRAVPGQLGGRPDLGQGHVRDRHAGRALDPVRALIHLERIKSEHVVGELTRHVRTLPDQLRRSVTWDQGKEMALHANFTIDTGIQVQVYFCDPKSPWRRGTNENSNGLFGGRQ
jgi:IS30 family transposase